MSFDDAWPTHPGALALALAPMDGVTDWVHREVLTGAFAGHSGISFCVSEFVRVTAQPAPAKVLRRMCPELDTGGRTASGVPVVVQLLGGQPGPLADTAALAVELGAPAIDLNFGCPAKTVNRHDGGASLLREPARIEAIVAAVRDACHAPVSVKIRTGWDSADDVVTLARAAASGGAAWLTIHGRTRGQGYGGRADWRAIGRARAAVSIPVLANGDLCSVADVDACRRDSGCEAFMLGRGALARPALFRELRGLAVPGEARGRQGLHALLRLHAGRVRAIGGERAALNRLKQWLCLASRVAPALSADFEAVKRARDLEAALLALPPPSAAATADAPGACGLLPVPASGTWSSCGLSSARSSA